jgi:hypothetical protein
MRAMIVIVLGALCGLARADELPVAPASGVDQDLADAVAEAKADLAKGDREAATTLVLRIHLANDRFTKAQAPLLVEPSRAILTAAARDARPEDAARYLDAAWQLGGRKPDPAYAKLLVDLAEKRWDGSHGEALFLARRAAVVDPGNARAGELDRTWSRNQNRWLALGVQIAGLGTAGVGAGFLVAAHGTRAELSQSVRMRAELDELVDRQRSQGKIGSIALGAGLALFVAGVAYHVMSEPRFEPASPGYLPALAEAR